MDRSSNSLGQDVDQEKLRRGSKALTMALPIFNSAAIDFDRSILPEDSATLRDILHRIVSEVDGSRRYIERLNRLREEINRQLS